MIPGLKALPEIPARKDRPGLKAMKARLAIREIPARKDPLGLKAMKV